jgi:hypothetical protein
MTNTAEIAHLGFCEELRPLADAQVPGDRAQEGTRPKDWGRQEW